MDMFRKRREGLEKSKLHAVGGWAGGRRTVGTNGSHSDEVEVLNDSHGDILMMQGTTTTLRGHAGWWNDP